MTTIDENDEEPPNVAAKQVAKTGLDGSFYRALPRKVDVHGIRIANEPRRAENRSYSAQLGIGRINSSSELVSARYEKWIQARGSVLYEPSREWVSLGSARCFSAYSSNVYMLGLVAHKLRSSNRIYA